MVSEGSAYEPVVSELPESLRSRESVSIFGIRLLSLGFACKSTDSRLPAGLRYPGSASRDLLNLSERLKCQRILPAVLESVVWGTFGSRSRRSSGSFAGRR